MQREISEDSRPDQRPPADLTLVIRKLILAKIAPFNNIKRIHYHPFRGIWMLDFVRANGAYWYKLQDLLAVTEFKKVYNKYNHELIIFLHWEREIDDGRFDHLPTIWGGSEQTFL